jgi:hypothetical protein
VLRIGSSMLQDISDDSKGLVGWSERASRT